MSNFKYVETIGYVNVDNIKYISDVFQRCDTWNFNIHFIDNTTSAVQTDSEVVSEAIIRRIIEK